MGQPVALTRQDHTASELRKLAGGCDDAEAVRRILAIAAVQDGCSRTEAARNHGMDRQTLCDWVHRYNAAGIAGLSSRKSPGRAAALNEQQRQELKTIVINGPDPEKQNVVRWRCRDLCQEVDRRYQVHVHERTMGKWLRQLGLTRLQPRPSHPKKDAAAQELFKKVLALP